MEQNNHDNLPTLIAQTGPLNGQRWLLNQAILIGRDETCDIVIPSRLVSRYHARLTPNPDGALLEDLGSKNGTHHNSVPVMDPVTLQDGDVLQIALAQEFVYLSSDATLPLDAASQGTGIAPSTTLRGPQAFRLRLDKRSRRVWVKDQEVLPPLSMSQFQLLELLCDHQGQIVSRTELIDYVWGEEDAVGVTEQALDALIHRLRDRLAVLDPSHAYIITVRGHGLRLENPPVE